VLNPDGTFTYTPDANFNGSDSFIYEISNGNGGTAQATVTLTVNPVNDTPRIVSFGGNSNVNLTIDESSSVIATVNATDADGDTISYQINGGADSATMSINADTGQLRFNAPPDFESPSDQSADNTYEVTVIATDASGGTSSQSFTVNVADINEAPSIQDQTVGLSQLDVFSVQASDPDASDSLTFAMLGGDPAFVVDSASGAVSLADDSDLQFEPGQYYPLTVEVTDTQGLTATATVNIFIDTGNSAPAPATDPAPQEPVSGEPSASGDPAPETASEPAQESADPESSDAPLPTSSAEPIGQPTAHILTEEVQNPESERAEITVDPAHLPTAGIPISNAQNVRILINLDVGTDTGQLAPYTVVDSSFNRLSLDANLGARTTELLDVFSQRLSDAGQAHMETQINVAKTATAATLTLSAGFAAWTLRSGALLASLFASSPLWRQFDPLPIVGRDEDEEEAGVDIDGEEMFSNERS